MRDMSRIKIQIAREFRKKPTKSEKLMWQVLRNRQFRNLKFRRQHLIEGYLLDFYCHELRLAIEIDGPIHSKQIVDDQARQKIIEHFDIKFFRVKSSEVESDLGKVLERLDEFIPLTLPSPAPSVAGEGKKMRMSFSSAHSSREKKKR